MVSWIGGGKGEFSTIMEGKAEWLTFCFTGWERKKEQKKKNLLACGRGVGKGKDVAGKREKKHGIAGGRKNKTVNSAV